MVRKAGVFRPRELDRVGIPGEYLRRRKIADSCGK
jgi:hypothetical protein